MTNFKLLTLVLLTTVIAFSSCKKEELDINDANAIEVKLSRETDYGEDWIYFSFADGKEVTVTDYKTSLNWDIAFNRYNVRTNGGKSGSGQAGAYDAGKVDWNTVLEAKENGYIADDTIQIVKEFTGGGVTYMTSDGNTAFEGCIDRGFSVTGPTYSSNEHVYVVKTADGKYAKLIFLSFYNDEGESGYLSFKYFYKNDGNRNFE